MAGQITQWKRVMSLPTTWSWAGHRAPEPAAWRRRPVVGQGVEPDVGGLRLAVAGWAGKGDSPAEPAPAGGDVLEPLAEQAEDLVAPDLGPHEIGVLLQQILEELLIAAETEEPVALLDHLERAGRMQDALAVDDLRLGLEASQPTQ